MESAKKNEVMERINAKLDKIYYENSGKCQAYVCIVCDKFIRKIWIGFLQKYYKKIVFC